MFFFLLILACASAEISKATRCNFIVITNEDTSRSSRSTHYGARTFTNNLVNSIDAISHVTDSEEYDTFLNECSFQEIGRRVKSIMAINADNSLDTGGRIIGKPNRGDFIVKYDDSLFEQENIDSFYNLVVNSFYKFEETKFSSKMIDRVNIKREFDNLVKQEELRKSEQELCGRDSCMIYRHAMVILIFILSFSQLLRK